MRVRAVAFHAAFLAATVVATGCARTWPTVRSVGDQDFLAAGGVRTIDVLPLDVGVSSIDENPDMVADRFAIQATHEIRAHLLGRGYTLNAEIGPDGVYQQLNGEMAIALQPAELDAIESSLAAYGSAQASVPGQLLTPYLPVRLGAATGADATLYVGGWAYAGRDPKGISGADVAKVVIVALFIVVVVAVAIVAAKGLKGHGGGGGGGGAAQAAGRAGGAAARAAGNAGSAAARAIGGAGRAAVRGAGRVAQASARVVRGFAEAGDAWGRSHTHVNFYMALPANPQPPPEAGPSRTLLEMTLVDNRRGLVLWHARQEFPASPARKGDVVDVINSMMGGLPAVR